MKRNTKLRHWLEAGLIMALPYALSVLPFGLRVRVGGRIIGGVIGLVPKLRRRIKANLSLVYPDMPAKDLAHLATSVRRNIGARYIEMFFNAAFQKRRKFVHCSAGAMDEIKAAQVNGQPVILVSGHFGAWEAGRMLLREAGLESAGVYKESGNPIHEKRHANNLAEGGKPMFNTTLRGVRAMLKHIKKGGILTILLDQRVNEAAPIEFMGLPALTSTVTAEIAIKNNALVVPMYGVFRPNGRDIDVYFEPSVPLTDPKTLTKALNDSLSARVWANPEQWYWLHNRWARPDLQE